MPCFVSYWDVTKDKPATQENPDQHFEDQIADNDTDIQFAKWRYDALMGTIMCHVWWLKEHSVISKRSFL